MNEKAVYSPMSNSQPKVETPDQGGYQKLRSGLVYGEDFVMVSHEVWTKLHQTFGGGPELKFYPIESHKIGPNMKVLTKS